MGCWFSRMRQLEEAKSVLGLETRELFDALDEDKNGMLAFHEITHVLRAAGVAFYDKDVANLMNLYDTNGDGRISFEEFQRILRDQIHSRAENLISLFKIYDVNKDNQINLIECMALFRDVGVPQEKLKESVLEYFPTPASQIGFKDFCKIFSQYV